jgi:predicted ester cyclase
VDGFDVDRFERSLFDDAWNRPSLAALASRHATDFRFDGPTGRRFSGVGAYLDLVSSLRGPFPDLDLQVDEVYWMGNERDGFLVAVRWSADATHAAPGIYGEPTGSEVQIWGITQHRIRDGRITHEWMLFNELDLMMQIAAARR